MGCAGPDIRTAHRVPPGSAITLEPWRDFAAHELQAVYAAAALPCGGRICDHPDCAVVFTPRIHRQMYCGKDCKRADFAERRAVGAVIAPACLAHRTHKYDKPGTAGHALCSAARRYIGQVQSHWFDGRKTRKRLAIERLSSHDITQDRRRSDL